jgi:hypothetical protein
MMFLLDRFRIAGHWQRKNPLCALHHEAHLNVVRNDVNAKCCIAAILTKAYSSEKCIDKSAA